MFFDRQQRQLQLLSNMPPSSSSSGGGGGGSGKKSGLYGQDPYPLYDSEDQDRSAEKEIFKLL